MSLKKLFTKITRDQEKYFPEKEIDTYTSKDKNKILSNRGYYSDFFSDL